MNRNLRQPKTKPNNTNRWKIKISNLKVKTEQIENLIENLDSSDFKLEKKLKLIQGSNRHLSFHLVKFPIPTRLQ